MPEPTTVAFLLFPDLTPLDLVGPAQVLSRLGDARLLYVAKTREPVMGDAGYALVPTAVFDEVPAADVLCIPGGFGTTRAIEDDETIAWVARVGATARWVTSVCTGSLVLGAAGLLRGYRAATHWAWRDLLPLFGAEPVAARTVTDRNRMTGGGVTAGLDFALTLLAELRGADHARLVQLGMEYDPAPPFDAGSPERAGEALEAAYRLRTDELMPTRGEDMRAAAARRGFG